MLNTGPVTDAPKHVLCHYCHRYGTCYRGAPLDLDEESTAYRLTWIEGPFDWVLELDVIRDAPVRQSKWVCVACTYRLVAAA